MAANRGGGGGGGRAKLSGFFLFFFFFFVAMETADSQNQSCDGEDLAALEGFLIGIESGIGGWSSIDCCTWPGVTCGPPPSSRIVGLNLTGMRLKGGVSASLAGLSQVRSINLSDNSLRGPIPQQLFQLPLLEYLDLSMNDLSGPVPANSSLPSLRVFNVSQNSLNSTQPVFGDSANLSVFDISFNFFSGHVNSSICNASPGIQILSFSANFFSGEIPAGIGNCSSLEELSLDTNGLSGSLPDELFRLSSLKTLFLQSNSFSGELSQAIGNLSSLNTVDFSTNNFSGTIPDAFSALRMLESFAAISNGFSGGLPASLSALSSLTELSLRNNSLTGEIDLDFAGMTKLSVLDLGSNDFAGKIPESLAECAALETLNLATNNLTGEIPASFGNLTSLSVLSLSKNKLTGLASALEILGSFPNLTYAVLTRNFHGETMPTSVQGFQEIEVLVIANCGLVGVVPQWLARCGKLQVLDLSWNRLEGSIPPWIGDFGSLFYLDLSNNSLSGEIPEGLTKLQVLISGNMSISSSTSASEFPFFMKKNASAKGLQYNQVGSFPPSMVLGHNALVGPIPVGLGGLKNLLVLDLSWNNLSGEIPNGLSGMTNIETMELSHNEFNGSIPASLAGLSFLSSFDVSYNRLSGKIPAGGQFSTFSSVDFAGNPGLCGGFNFTACAAAAPPPRGGGRKNKGAVVGMAFGIGIATSLLLSLLYVAIVARARIREDGVVKVADANDLSPPETSLVLLFQNKDRVEGNDVSIADIVGSTNNFSQSHIIGCGGFGLVYKATLPDGSHVAIKRLSGDFCQMEREFQAEVEALSTARHPNLVLLQGYCRIGSARLLIYSFMENGSLDYWLHESSEKLDWRTRLAVARDSAKGLYYLHQSCEPHILHRDIKSSNILLDGDFVAHLADFGLARLILPSDTHVTTDVVGTLGYIPPEYAHSTVATFKGDVYSFGVVLLELLTGRRPVDVCKPKASRDLVAWVSVMRKEKRDVEVFDHCIYKAVHEKEMMQVLDIACQCVSESPKLRPLTFQLVSLLDSIVAGAGDNGLP